MDTGSEGCLCQQVAHVFKLGASAPESLPLTLWCSCARAPSWSSQGSLPEILVHPTSRLSSGLRSFHPVSLRVSHRGAGSSGCRPLGGSVWPLKDLASVSALLLGSLTIPVLWVLIYPFRINTLDLNYSFIHSLFRTNYPYQMVLVF